MGSYQTTSGNRGLRYFSKLVVASTLFLIFAGGMVTSTSSGLSVPDWPLSYGSLFPPMVGGVFYEHGHRMIAATVGFLMVILAVWLALAEERRWVRNLGFVALGAVIAQGLLGGITVLFFLPTVISVAHGILAQTFFILTIVIAYSLSVERRERKTGESPQSTRLMKLSFVLATLIYVQLILGAIMRHTHSGLAIPDFPSMGGTWWPAFDEGMLQRINAWRFEHDLDPVTMGQVAIHFIHRAWAVLILFWTILVAEAALKKPNEDARVVSAAYLILSVIAVQILLGIFTVLSIKTPVITSLHVMTGAIALGVSILLVLRSSPINWKEFKKALS